MDYTSSSSTSSSSSPHQHIGGLLVPVNSKSIITVHTTADAAVASRWESPVYENHQQQQEMVQPYRPHDQLQSSSFTEDTHNASPSCHNNHNNRDHRMFDFQEVTPRLDLPMDHEEYSLLKEEEQGKIKKTALAEPVTAVPTIGCSSSNSRGSAVIEKEHMFDKVVTPSDVGKLNRLVIPKQHAEKYFPLDSSTNEKSLLLNFEDRNGKSWRFRYSYWNSSQSYVMTKGWSRFVKEKKLDAGDIVSFQRGVGELGKLDRFYIDWRGRPADAQTYHGFNQRPYSLHHYQQQYNTIRGGGTCTGLSNTSGNNNVDLALATGPVLMFRHSPPPLRSSRSMDHRNNHVMSLVPPQFDTNHHFHPHPHNFIMAGRYTSAGRGSSEVHAGTSTSYGYGNAASLTNNPSAGHITGPFVYQLRPAQTAAVAPYDHQQQIGGDSAHVMLVQPFAAGAQYRPDHMMIHNNNYSSNMVLDSVPVVQGTTAAAKRFIRLFGVNMDCPVSSDDHEPAVDGGEQGDDSCGENVVPPVPAEAEMNRFHQPSSNQHYYPPHYNNSPSSSRNCSSSFSKASK